MRIANRIGVFDALNETPLSAEQVADKCKAVPALTEKLLIACAALELVTQKNGKYENTELTDRYLIKGHRTLSGWVTAQKPS